MSELEARTLEECEAVIERGLATFVEVGRALLRIRDERLYRDHGTFEEYCRKRWNFSDSRARQLVAAAETVTDVTVSGLPAPKTEAVARVLAPLRSEPQQMREAWTETVDRHGERPTAAQVREVVEERRRDPRADVVAEAADRDIQIRRTRALRVFLEAVHSVAKVAVGFDDISDAITHDQRRDNRARIDEALATLERLRAATESEGLRRVK